MRKSHIMNLLHSTIEPLFLYFSVWYFYLLPVYDVLSYMETIVWSIQPIG